MTTEKQTEKRAENDKIYIIWIGITILLTVIGFCLFASITVYIDPLFHFHGPLENYEYPLNDEIYQNDGITRNFEYDSIITGTSVVENFKTSEADDLFDANFVKVPFFGSYYKETNENLRRAYDAGKNIKYVIRSLDYTYLIADKDSYRDDAPAYLNNYNLFDDVNYVLNKSVLFDQTWNVIKYTEAGNKTTDFDAYANWNDSSTFGEEAVLASYTLGEAAESDKELSEYETAMMYENIVQNITAIADEHPETTFYLFFPPYSICYWDVLNNDGEIDWRIEAEQIAIEEILKHSNIKLYSFCNNFELVCNLDNYTDRVHYGEWVNSWILEWMQDDKYLLTKDNYEIYIETIKDFYNSYNYSLLHE